MTTDQRRKEIASILARGLLRRVRAAKQTVPAPWNGSEWTFCAVDDRSQYLFNAVRRWWYPYPLKTRRNA